MVTRKGGREEVREKLWYFAELAKKNLHISRHNTFFVLAHYTSSPARTTYFSAGGTKTVDLSQH